ncbi:hypothetical protein NDU88_009318 [Pleurodeles waltl]|uniref:Uncharacterized protein n=1 Tax=Pleurodeles waltl TaxID=8319 RepID=A0AAV7QUV1_PLEWA|nr:hypothetical protein NDU88_009318 [Pleurodeles waltl]
MAAGSARSGADLGAAGAENAHRYVLQKSLAEPVRALPAKRLLTRRWKATTAPTTTQWKAEVMEWGKAEGAALRREDNSGMRECPVAPDWDKLMEKFETLSEEEDE